MIRSNSISSPCCYGLACGAVENCSHIYFLYFVSLVKDWILARDPREEIEKAFRLFDDDGTGKVSIRNLRRVARELGETMTDEELRAMIDEFDTDGDGESEW